ncbi:hypothetical protein [Nannocystis pusilla]|uniref:Uncharacterized protein n=1 Tax=Nannocystis pusilla TaxID=889268 RepID=A0ABS7TPD2_9BACT|nr:hypothetical protein [Nannocystis pusilla]MBZ5710075.1 hypothetical protein [Nannocystis pusilla]
MSVDYDLARPYCVAALTALRFLDERTGRRRFGPDADARWRAFAGEDLGEVRHPGTRVRVLDDADRIELLLRDADAQWPGAFGARVVFDLPAVARDDAFGPEWTPIAEAHALWRDVAATKHPDLARLVARLFAVWDVAFVPPRLPALQLSSRWLLHGPNAVAAALLAFSASQGAVWHTQVVVIAEPPLVDGLRPHQRRVRALARQLATLAGGLLSQQGPTQLLGHVPEDSEHPGYQRITSDLTER